MLNMAAVYDCTSLISIPYSMSFFPVMSKRVLANNALPWIVHKICKNASEDVCSSGLSYELT